MVLAMARPASGSCPLNHFDGCGTGTDSSLPVDGQSCGTPCSITGGEWINTRYDIPNGVLSADVSICGDGYGYAEVTMQDDFTLYGLPAGTSVVLAAHFIVSISSNDRGYPTGDGTL